MLAADLIEILNEYPLSTRLVLKNKGRDPLEATVYDMVAGLMRRPHDESVVFFGLNSCIIRERVKLPKYEAVAPPGCTYLEMDWR